MPTLAFLTGFEHGIVAASSATGTNTDRLWDSVSGTPADETTIVRSGSHALRINPSAAAEYVSRAIAAGNRLIVGSLYFRLVSLPTGGDFRLLSTSTTAGGQIFVIDTSGVLYAEPGGDSAQRQSAGTLNTGQWYRLDFRSDTSGTNHTIDWQLDGSAKTQATTSDSPGAQDQTNFRLGTTLSATGDVCYDDFLYSFTTGDYPLGQYVIKGYGPDADGTHGSTYAAKFRDAAGVDISGSNVAWDNLTSPNESTVRVEQYARVAGQDATTYVEVSFSNSSESSAPSSVMGIAGVLAAGTSSDNLTVEIVDNGTASAIFSGDPSQTSIAHMVKVWNTRPSDASAWTDAAFDALLGRVGHSSDINPVPYCAGVMLEAAFAVSAGDNITDAGNIATAEAFGTPSIPDRFVLSAGNIATAEAFGTQAAQLNTVPSGIASEGALGSPSAQANVSGAGNIATGETFGTQAAQLNTVPSGIASGEAVGSPVASLDASPTAIDTAEAFGSPTVSTPEFIVIDHETGVESDYWAVGLDPDNDITVAAGAALAGTNYGLNVLIDDTGNKWVHHSLAAADTSGIYRCRFYLDVNSFTNSVDEVGILALSRVTGGNTYVAECYLIKNAGVYYLRLKAYNDAGGATTVAEATLTDEPHFIEFKVVKATGAGNNDGIVDLWVDGTYIGGAANVDNDTRAGQVGRINAGMWFISAGTSGTIFIDEIIVNDTGDEIGPVGGGDIISAAGNIATAEAFGSPTLSQDVSAAGNIPTSEALGSPSAAVVTSPSGIATAEAFGQPTIPDRFVSGAGNIETAEAFGNATVTSAGNISDAGNIATAEAFGTQAAQLNLSSAGNIATGESVSNPVTSLTVSPTGIASAEAFGSPTLSTTVSPAGIPTAEELGQPTVLTGANIANAGDIATGEAFGQPTITATYAIVDAGAIGSAQAFGSAAISLPVSATGIPSAQALGSPSASPSLSPSGIASAQALGTPTLSDVISPVGITTSEVFGASALILPISQAGGIASATAFGTPLVVEQGIATEGLVAAGDTRATAIAHNNVLIARGLSDNEPANIVEGSNDE